MVRVDSESVSRALDSYLPELTSGEMRDYLSRRLEEVDSVAEGLSEAEFPAPASYDPELDTDGRLVDYFRHFVLAWTRDLEREVSGFTCLSEDNTVFQDHVAAQVQVVAELLVRTLLQELYLRRSRDQLQGESPEGRYRSFREWTNSAEGHRELLSRYPRAFQTACASVRTAGSGLLHILSQVELNRERLDSLAGVTEGVLIATVAAGRGDMHNGGRSVAEIVFEDGARILYKPRPLDSEVGFNALVRWFNERLGTSLSTVEVLTCRDEGFVEYVRAGEPRSGEREYFAQIGQLLGILYLVKAIDIHFENVVTCAEGPVVVDTETLLTPALHGLASGDARSAREKANAALRESVFGIGVLPFAMRAGESGEAALDVGVIGYDPGQQTPYKHLQLRNPGRDDMFVELAQGTSANATTNLSISRATGMPVREQRDTIKRELRRVLGYTASHKEEVRAAIEEFLGDASFRFLHHATSFYSQLRRMVTHPDAMVDPLARKALLSRVFLGARGRYEIAEDEARQLAEGDVPYFCYSARSRALLAGDGRVVLEDAFHESGLDAALNRISELGDEAIDRQSTLVDLSFVPKLLVSDDVTGFAPRRSSGSAPVRVDRSRLLEEATRVGDAFVDGMVDGPDDGPAVWIGPQVAAPEGEEWNPGVSGYDLYNGMPGIALALAGLARETGEERFRRAALRVIEPFERLLSEGPGDLTGTAYRGMCGMDGIVYTTATARRILGGGGLSVGELARALLWDIEPPKLSDFITGSAGTLAICLSLHRNAVGEDDRKFTEEAAKVYAARVMSDAAEHGTADGRLTEYIGYAHGDIGIAAPLLEYASVFGDRDAAERGTRMAAAVRDAQRDHTRDWPRMWEEVDDFSYAWCHGAPGILLGALEVTRHVPGIFPEQTLSRLAELTVTRGFGTNPTYCHGDLGSLETVLLAEQVSPGLFGDGVDDLYPRLFTDVIERYSERADTKYAYNHGFMLGQAGMVWSVLRHLDPGTYPSVVRLE
ncbi:type 2 lanthipeptide synthetase LanM [Nocardiopsis aegyptia]|uniref:Type 2 lantibiotic biosynthesis protein LanM n=1 Tax=Nocardiopsis aegyptia TaxID=220378 RepID=A0A7Z0EQ30_9ACTN|nr:type 2 lanthipeptide synthetase LanM [Nocardiopsis aegyptia]NYJ35616.1 type 2 lantibiotic biosynthesis protein LanM [Nocardiopsis aegyptia]